MHVALLLLLALPPQEEGIRIERRGDGATVVETPSGPVRVETRTEGRPFSSRTPASGVRLNRKQLEEYIDDRKKVKEEWT